jgi:hypothetical protein
MTWTVRIVLATAMLVADAASAQSVRTDDAAYCAGTGSHSAWCDGYTTGQCFNIASEERAKECREGMYTRQAQDTGRAREKQRAEEERERRQLLSAQPLTVGANPLLGQWRRVASASSRGFLSELTEIACAQVQGPGPFFEFRADALVHGSRTVSRMQYRAGPNGVVYAFGEPDMLRQLAFRFEGRDRMILANCIYARVGAGGAVSNASRAPPKQASPSPSNQSLFSIFGVRLGADRFDAVKTMLDRNRADFFDYFDATSVLDDATRKVISRRLVVSDARFSGIGPRNTRVWFDFANETDPVLSTVTVLYGPGIAGLQAERVAALTRQFGVDDGKGNATQWHRVVPGADIALFANPQTGAVNERYAYSNVQPSGAAPIRGACPAIRVTVAQSGFTDETISFKAGPASPDALFNWKVSAGTIGSGQGTSDIAVSVTGLASSTPFTAEVAVSEDPACKDQVRTGSTTAKVP